MKEQQNYITVYISDILGQHEKLNVRTRFLEPPLIYVSKVSNAISIVQKKQS